MIDTFYDNAGLHWSDEENRAIETARQIAPNLSQRSLAEHLYYYQDAPLGLRGLRDAALELRGRSQAAIYAAIRRHDSVRNRQAQVA